MAAVFRLNRPGLSVSDERVCAGADVDPLWWDLDNGSAADLATGEYACTRKCSLTAPCLQEALQGKERGLYGGLVTDEEGKTRSVDQWLVKRDGRPAGHAPEVVAKRICPECNREFDVIAPGYTRKYCRECGPVVNANGSKARLAKSRRERIVARVLADAAPTAVQAAG